MTEPIITIELCAPDAHRLLWLVQNAAAGPVYDAYWAQIANHIRQNIDSDTPAPQPWPAEAGVNE